MANNNGELKRWATHRQVVVTLSTYYYSYLIHSLYDNSSIKSTLVLVVLLLAI